jgi:hypothetical protein
LYFTPAGGTRAPVELIYDNVQKSEAEKHDVSPGYTIQGLLSQIDGATTSRRTTNGLTINKHFVDVF